MPKGGEGSEGGHNPDRAAIRIRISSEDRCESARYLRYLWRSCGKLHEILTLSTDFPSKLPPEFTCAVSDNCRGIRM